LKATGKKKVGKKKSFGGKIFSVNDIALLKGTKKISEKDQASLFAGKFSQ